MAEQTVYCEECVEDIPADEVYWEEGRLYCRRCGSEIETQDREIKDIFEEIQDNRTGFVFRNEDPSDADLEEDDGDEDEDEDEVANDEEE